MNTGTSSNPDSIRDAAKKASGQIPKVCASPTIMNIIILVLCPPLALFFDRGIQGLFHVLVCGLLTVKLYYFPGFIYAALHILC